MGSCQAALQARPTCSDFVPSLSWWPVCLQSKLANLLFVRELTARLCAAGVTNVAAIAVHPGTIGAPLPLLFVCLMCDTMQDPSNPHMHGWPASP